MKKTFDKQSVSNRATNDEKLVNGHPQCKQPHKDQKRKKMITKQSIESKKIQENKKQIKIKNECKSRQ